MDVNLDGMIILVTGAASGIGRGIAKQAVASGAAGLVLTDRDEVGLEKVKASLGAQCDIRIIPAELCDASNVSNLAQQALAAFGRIDGLVNAAGVTTRAGFEDGTSAAFDSIFAINVRAPFLLMQAVFADMIEKGHAGTVVNIQSATAHCGEIELSLYSASKGALQTLTKNAAHTHLGNRIRVNGINLGWTETESEHYLQAEVLGRGADWAANAAIGMPFGRLLQPDDAARLAIYLLSPASTPLTGVSIDLDQRVVGGP